MKYRMLNRFWVHKFHVCLEFLIWKFRCKTAFIHFDEYTILNHTSFCNRANQCKQKIQWYFSWYIQTIDLSWTKYTNMSLNLPAFFSKNWIHTHYMMEKITKNTQKTYTWKNELCEIINWLNTNGKKNTLNLITN